LINIYTEKEIFIMKIAGQKLAQILIRLKNETKEGITGNYLNKMALKLIKTVKAEPSFLHYNNFPAALCVSVNNVLVHGLPNDIPFKNKDIISLDLGLKWRGYYTDKAISFSIGNVDLKTVKMIQTTKRALDEAIKKVSINTKLGEISSTIQNIIELSGFSVAENLFGHGVGKNVHEEPRIPNFGEKNDGPILKEGMVLAIEPMVCQKNGQIQVLPDRFSIGSKDGSVCCHFEDSVAVTKKGPKVLTRT